MYYEFSLTDKYWDHLGVCIKKFGPYEWVIHKVF